MDKRDQIGDYKSFLELYLDKGYEFISFHDEIKPKGQIILRHDIDFNTKMALLAGKVEKDLGITSTFFFLLRSDFYNVLSPKNLDAIEEIAAMGHKISIHFDPTIYDDFAEGLHREVALFKSIFDLDVNIISLHRPNHFFLEFDQAIGNIEHTYMSKYFKDIKYFADSTGKWRYGRPQDSLEFQNYKTLQLLIHPIWWFVEGDNSLDKLSKYWKICSKELMEEFGKNSKPFRELDIKI